MTSQHSNKDDDVPADLFALLTAALSDDELPLEGSCIPPQRWPELARSPAKISPREARHIEFCEKCQGRFEDWLAIWPPSRHASRAIDFAALRQSPVFVAVATLALTLLLVVSLGAASVVSGWVEVRRAVEANNLDRFIRFAHDSPRHRSIDTSAAKWLEVDEGGRMVFASGEVFTNVVKSLELELEPGIDGQQITRLRPHFFSVSDASKPVPFEFVFEAPSDSVTRNVRLFVHVREAARDAYPPFAEGSVVYQASLACLPEGPRVNYGSPAIVAKQADSAGEIAVSWSRIGVTPREEQLWLCVSDGLRAYPKFRVTEPSGTARLGNGAGIREVLITKIPPGFDPHKMLLTGASIEKSRLDAIVVCSSIAPLQGGAIPLD
ncbi:MAG: hypothetical protein SFU86_23855 [Pirellulaceae bacterium]|nr:hypothetical protein [Pirellulaceae bacterium]